MDVSDQHGPGGTELLSTIVDLTGLPAPIIHEELEKILADAGCSADSVTLESLRGALLKHLESLQAEWESSDLSISSRLNATPFSE